MTTAARRSLILIEALAFSAYVAWYIWQLQAFARSLWLVFPGWMLASFIVHRDTPKTLGWRADNFGLATKGPALVFLPWVAAPCLLGIFLGPIPTPGLRLFIRGGFFCCIAFFRAH